MSTESIRLRDRPAGAQREVMAWWASLSATVQTRIKIAVLLGLVAAAFHYTLSSLVQTLGYDTPLAYVGLVPVLALGLAWMHRNPRTIEPPIHDRQLDYILGLPLVVGTALLAVALPNHLGAMYWVNRLDLVLLPLFVAGATILLFGTRVAWRQKMAIAYLFLAWPWPYTHILLGTLGGFTSITLDGLRTVLHVIPVAQPVSGPANAGLFQVVHHGHTFPVSVVTACSGVDGMVGFFLVGAGFAGTVAGGRIRKTIWLAVGLVLLWTTNLARLLFIFWIGKVAGEHLAINILHPVAGLVIFCVGVVFMMLLLRPFGLRMIDVKTMGRSAGGPASATGASRVFLAAGIVALVGLFLAVNNSTLTRFDPVASASGEPKLGSFLAQPASPVGWTANWETEYTSNKPLFGQSSRWFRYLYTPTGAPTNLHSSIPVTADVINSASLSSFAQYGVTACYSFHGYTLSDVARVDLGDGITGQSLSYAGDAGFEDWSIVWWIWPVSTDKGTRYERIILYLQNTAAGTVSVTGDVPGINGLKGALTSASAQQRRLITNRAFLVEFAREVVQGQTKKTDTAIDIAELDPAATAPVELGGTTSSVAAASATNRGAPVRHSARSSVAAASSAGIASAPANAAAILKRFNVKAPTGAVVDAPTRNLGGSTLWQRIHVRAPVSINK